MIIKTGLGVQAIERAVAALDEFLGEKCRIDLTGVKSHAPLSDGLAPATVYSYWVYPGFSVWIGCGWFQSPDADRGLEPILFGEIAITELPNDWDTIMGLLTMNHRAPGYTKLAILDQGEALLGVDIVLHLFDLEPARLPRILEKFLYSAERTFELIKSKYPQLESLGETLCKRKKSKTN
jgi:hypothetical protein